MTMDRDTHIQRYLEQFDAATNGLRPDLRDELRADVRDHLDELRLTAGTEAEVLNGIDRLGPPGQIVRAAIAEHGDTVTAPAAPPAHVPVGVPGVGNRRGSRGLDIAAILLLVFGTLVVSFFLGPFGIGAWVLGVVLLWMSPRFSTGEKVLATAVWPGGVVAPLFSALFATQRCVTTEIVDDAGQQIGIDEACEGFAFPVGLGLPLWIVLVLAPIVVGFVVLRRAHRRDA
jgi:hypothetical protein